MLINSLIVAKISQKEEPDIQISDNDFLTNSISQGWILIFLSQKPTDLSSITAMWFEICVQNLQSSDAVLGRLNA